MILRLSELGVDVIEDCILARLNDCEEEPEVVTSVSFTSTDQSFSIHCKVS